jgi:glutamate dehydrogenase
MSTRELRKLERVDELEAIVRERFEGAEGEAAGSFSRSFFGQLAPDDLFARSLETLAEVVASLWSAGAKRRPGEALVRVLEGSGADGGRTPAESRADSRVDSKVRVDGVELVNDDMPFLVDSVTGALTTRGLDVKLLVHPVVEVARTAAGQRGPRSEPADGEAALRESYIYVEIGALPDSEAREELRRGLAEVLGHVRAAVEDWRGMRSRLRGLVEELEAKPPAWPGGELDETAAFLRWLEEENFIFLGYRQYELLDDGDNHRLKPVDGSGLGLSRDAFRTRPAKSGSAKSRSAKGKAPVSEMAVYARLPNLLVVTKSHVVSTVHRPAKLDYIAVKRFDAEGRVVGEDRFLGLFTSLAYSRRTTKVPLVRRKVSAVLERAGFAPSSHDGKALVHVLETYPRDELFQIDEDELYDNALGILRLQERRRVALFVRRDLFERFVSCLVFVPSDRYDTDLRHRMAAILEEAYAGSLASFHTQVGDEPLARVHFIIKTTPGAVPKVRPEEIEARLAEAARTWQEDLARNLVEGSQDAVRGEELARRYAGAFPTAYREVVSAQEAVFDIDKIEAALASDRISLHLYCAARGADQQVRFKIYRTGRPVSLSRVVPLFEDLGFRVVAEVPYEVCPAGVDQQVWLRDFELSANVDGLDVDAVRASLEETFARVWYGDAESDRLNQLVLTAGLQWRQIAILRAACKYLRQAGNFFPQTYVRRAVVAYPQVAGQLIELFEARFAPDLPAKEREERSSAVEARIAGLLDEVADLDADRILRRFLDWVENILRTNYFQNAQLDPSRTEPSDPAWGAAGNPKDYLSFKLDSRRLAGLPAPRPMVEIFVYSPAMEGIHLRGGLVARGGIRWSDRREDFRTEILGLMKAQTVKNAVIVPVGAKGGFVVKQPPSDPALLREEGVRCYQTLIRGLLDLTDNYRDGELVAPPRVVRRDGDDPYLVVAADKGTATFSDIANELSAEVRFWLGDAFASGGSLGYDHKAMGITARGAWKSVKRHFRELGVNCQKEDFTVVGVGDMSGDVFGNGMLLSRHIRLLAAFNHRHIFLDPDPNAKASFGERKRLFKLPRSSWSDYKPELISPGGGVFERLAKSIELSPEAAERFGLEPGPITPNDLIRALLVAEVDLLWLGGIGTYVKASDETDADVGDRANNAVRVDASSLRCRVVGEGANLGFTQRARIEAALAGSAINTDAIDNSAGVDTSDHEVNIKILLDEAIVRGELGRDERDALLAEMTDEVGSLVLRHNYLQTQAISVAQARGVGALEHQTRLMRSLERAGKLDRALEALPGEEALAERQANQEGLTRPEIAVLLAYAKISLYEEVLASDLPDAAELAAELPLYFPRALRERLGPAIERHRLRREILSTVLANSLVNRVGPTFVATMEGATGLPADAIASAYAVVREGFGLRSIWAAIEELDNKIPAAVQIEMLLETRRLVHRATLWLLRHRLLEVRKNLERFRPGIEELAGGLEEVLPASDQTAMRRLCKRLERKGVSYPLACRVASLRALGSALEIVRLASEIPAERWPLVKVGRAYFMVGSRFGLDWMRGAAGRLSAGNAWQREALSALVDELHSLQGELTGWILKAAPDASSARSAIDAYLAERAGLTGRVRELLADLRSAGRPELAMLVVGSHRLRQLVAG